jgi:hypothetical protein
MSLPNGRSQKPYRERPSLSDRVITRKERLGVHQVQPQTGQHGCPKSVTQQPADPGTKYGCRQPHGSEARRGYNFDAVAVMTIACTLHRSQYHVWTRSVTESIAINCRRFRSERASFRIVTRYLEPLFSLQAVVKKRRKRRPMRSCPSQRASRLGPTSDGGGIAHEGASPPGL